jgi:hypothetical protein
VKRGWKLGGEAWRTLRANRSLAAFPLVGGIAVVLVVGPPAAVGALLVDRKDTVPGVVLLALALYLASFVVAFFGVALAAAADRALRGEPFAMRDGMKVASGKLGAIAGWALINATVSLVIRALEQRSELAAVVAALIGGAWSVLTLLVLPVIALEGTGPAGALKRSAQLFRSHWGDQFRGMISVGIRVLPFTLGALALIAVGVLLLTQDGAEGRGPGAALVGVGAVVLALACWVGSTLRQVFAVALYRFVLDGQAVGEFSADELQGSVRTRRRGGRARTA